MMAEIIKKSRQIGIPAINLEPKAGKITGLNVAGNTGGFTVAAGPGHPDQGTIPAGIKLFKQPLSKENVFG